MPVVYVVFGGAFFILGYILMRKLKEWGIEEAVKDESAGLKAGLTMLLRCFHCAFPELVVCWE
jgi:hypothetical protein